MHSGTMILLIYYVFYFNGHHVSPLAPLYIAIIFFYFVFETYIADKNQNANTKLLWPSNRTITFHFLLHIKINFRKPSYSSYIIKCKYYKMMTKYFFNRPIEKKT